MATMLRARSRTRHRITFAAALVALAEAFGRGPGAAAGEFLSFVLDPQAVCTEGELIADAGTLERLIEEGECVVRAGSAAGSLDGFLSLGAAIQSRIPQPPEFFGFFREAQVDARLLVPSPPPAGSSVSVAQLLNHLIVVWVFEDDGIAVAPIGDPIAFVVPPAPPPFLAGAVIGMVRYGEAFDVSVGMTIDAHTVTVRQSGRAVAAAMLKKIFPHPDRMTHASVFLASGNLEGYPIWSYGDASFQGVESPAEAIIAGASEPSFEAGIGSIRRAGEQVIVTFRP
ncbi:MAG: hypothetical protein HY613_05395 [Candidatus Rokubacteria bacterium]|nr:hypothetical protein [Candidatus Rokubacteria bacterium]